MDQFTPKQIVQELSRYIIGQNAAKRAVAVALRNRYRRSRLSDALRDEITPKNIIMMGATGVGKTEIARRLAKLVKAPFIKVEATKYTEVGYVGRDVESMIRDLVETAVHLVRAEASAEIAVKTAELAKKRILDALKKSAGLDPETLEARLDGGELENEKIDVKVTQSPRPMEIMPGMGGPIDIAAMLGDLAPKNVKTRSLTVAEARKHIIAEESDKLLDNDAITAEAVRRAEQEGIIFIDEIDKIAGKQGGSGPDVSREGVQRDILPIVEGSTVMTKYGAIRTDFILFIASGAFHVAKVEDLIPELQGRFPIRVELQALTQKDFFDILTAPDNAITKQYTSLLAVDNILLRFTTDAVEALAEIAFTENERSENIGARRLHTVMEALLEDVSFNAGGDHPQIEVVIDKKYVQEHIGGDLKKYDLRKYIL
ncbi:MAG: ATP-dependent protease ATPase subunit HslU [Clostridiales bacterium]|jgi:ATP-dependent HslUV protease ATP-binding subunit HslU|nr:ATP-dependent protease ATPase subunit HslU [Clostridiales bacterium]